MRKVKGLHSTAESSLGNSGGLSYTTEQKWSITQNTIRHMDKKAVGNSQHGFIHQGEVMFFQPVMKQLAWQMRIQRWISFTLSSVRLPGLSLKILLEKLMKNSLDEQTVRCIENWFRGQAQRMADQQHRAWLEANNQQCTSWDNTGSRPD